MTTNEYERTYRSMVVVGLTEQIMQEEDLDFHNAMLHHIWSGSGWPAFQVLMYRLGVKEELLKSCTLSNKIKRKIRG